MKKSKAIITYLKDRALSLSNVIEYYESMERDKGYLTIDQRYSYDLAITRLNEIERLVDFIEGKGTPIE